MRHLVAIAAMLAIGAIIIAADEVTHRHMPGGTVLLLP